MVARKASELSGEKDWSILDTYALALFEAGKVEKAIEVEEKSLEIAREEGIREEFIADLKKALKKFQKALKEGRQG